MTAHSKDVTQYSCAVGSLIAGIALCYINFLTSGDVTNGVLGVLGMCISFSGGIFGISIYVRGKVTEVKDYIDSRLPSKEQNQVSHEEN